ncbi:MAG: hypothetical protein AB7M12_09230 [Hyphomonadaceae bacterium]
MNLNIDENEKLIFITSWHKIEKRSGLVICHGWSGGKRVVVLVPESVAMKASADVLTMQRAEEEARLETGDNIVTMPPQRRCRSHKKPDAPS